MNDDTLALRERIAALYGDNLRLEAEVKLLWKMVNEYRDKAQQNWDLVETVACGEQLLCEKCKKYHPCECDK